MTHPYSELYIEDLKETFGSMLQYVDRDLKYSVDDFYKMFLCSRAASGIEHANPKYIAGMSGIEMARDVIYEKTCRYPDTEPGFYRDRGEWYWTGYVLSHYQWMRNVRFSVIDDLGLKISTVRNMYILHEADITKFVECADEITGLDKGAGHILSYYRRLKGLSQRELSEITGVPLRMVQLYEQGRNDLSRANADYVVRLADTLGISVDVIV